MYKTLITSDRLNEIIRLIKESPEGIIVEMGSYMGGGTKWIADNFPNRRILSFDTFEGLPEKDWNENEIHKPNDFSDTSYESVKEYLKDYDNIILVKGYFPDSAIPFENTLFSFVHVDFDFYEGIKSCIDFFYPRLVKGGIMVFDDYGWGNCPGIKKALDESGIEYHPTNAKYQAYLVK